ncbi:MAG TPA: acyltransferase [Flavitalea sp.]|nr:acyltransferase [Flavitalea sp.]
MQQLSPSPNKTAVFFPNLDGLRFFSFLAVFLYHCYLTLFSQLKSTSPVVNNILSFVFRHGYLGVNFFFVLSGFLITYLLLREREMNGVIHVGKFYLRRILRIWPLYYLCIIIGFVLFPWLKHAQGEIPAESANAVYYTFFAANFDYMHTWPVKPDAILLSVLWSVAVEEQFYLSWPVLLRYIPFRLYGFIFTAIIIGSLIFRSFYTEPTEADHAIRYFHTFSLIGDMAVGGLIAYLYTYAAVFRSWVIALSKGAIAGIYMITVLLVLFKSNIFPCGVPVIFERLVIAIFFGLIIAEQNFSDNSIFKIGKLRTISKLGIYTYGLYCLHLVGMYITVKVIAVLGLELQHLSVALGAAILSLILSILIALASYHFYEKWFLRLKDKFAFIVKTT